MKKIKLGSDNLLTFSDFKNQDTGVAITGATVEAKLYDDNEDGGPTQLGATITFSDEGAGKYLGTLADTHADLAVGMTVRIELTADGGAGLYCLQKHLSIVEQVD